VYRGVVNPGLAYRLIVGALRLVVHIYFRRVEVTGVENLPTEGGGVLVAWHPNGLIDPGLILTHFPRQVVFGARSGLFKVPGLGLIIRGIGTVPIYRAQDASGSSDPEARRAANRGSLEALAAEVARGSFSCLFPEGTSHDAPHPVEIKTGAARFYYQARQLQEPGAIPPVIIPVGLHYDRKQLFRSSAHVVFHPPMELGELDLTPPADEPAEERRARALALTERIDHELHESAHATESWELHYLIRRTRKLVRAERALAAGANPGRPEMRERTLGFARVRQGYLERLATQPEVVQALIAEVRAYDDDMRALRLEDHEIDHPPRLAAGVLAFMLGLQVVLVYLLLPPVLALGYVVNLPPALALMAVVKAVSKEKKDEATVKLLLGVVLFPACWLAAGALGWLAYDLAHPWVPNSPDTPVFFAAFIVTLSAVGGAVALRYIQVARETWRAVSIRFARRTQLEAFAALRAQRREIYDKVMAVAEGLALPGEVTADGRVVKQVADGEHFGSG
jgi:1-acyl-sn-glycerol-3-phosphate acyltransferase